MRTSDLRPALEALAEQLTGELVFDSLSRNLYATDASVYREQPLAVAFPKDSVDLQRLVRFAKEQGTSLIPRTAGTSLAGQCVGNGIVVDVSRHMGAILDFDAEARTVRVQPGVVRDTLNRFLKPHGLFFSPITSTANRAMIGGMVGNNSSGTTSIVYGTTREKVLRLETILSDGSEAVFEALTPEALQAKAQEQSLEGSLYRWALDTLADPEVQEDIRQGFPKASIHRRNTGYALDYLAAAAPFQEAGEPFNFCKLLCGSEGTLALTTAVTLSLDPLPEPVEIVVAAHFNSIHDSMRGAQVAMQHPATAVELMDKIILDCTKTSLAYAPNRYFVEGDPEALLMIEFRGPDEASARAKGEALIAALQAGQLGYAYPIIGPEKTAAAWALRSAGLGLLANIPGDPKAVACIEDTAVAIEDLADYIAEFDQMMEAYGQKPVHYAHAGAGEIHLRPILDLKTEKGRADFYAISRDTALLVKKYRGSLSGEHGDGRVRAPFIPLVVGERNYERFRALKYAWDPKGIFNPGKIVDAAPMDSSLRYEAGMETPVPETLLDFSAEGGILRMAEKCNGSGDCRKEAASGGTMCPSYQATRMERDTTRGRANTLREFLTQNKAENPFDHPEIKEVLDLCLSCKGCTAECPSNVDMASMKAEFLHQYQKTHGVPLRSKAFAYIDRLNALSSPLAPLSNALLAHPLTGGLVKKVLGVAPERSLPQVASQSLMAWYRKHAQTRVPLQAPIKTVYLFVDEFTNYNEPEVGRAALELLYALNYDVRVLPHQESGRSALSKGLLEKARGHAEANVALFGPLIDAETPLIGLEPSALLSFRDEYPRLVRGEELRTQAKKLKQYSLLFEEFIGREVTAGAIGPESFTDQPAQVLIHGHCHQKALSSVKWIERCVGLPSGYQVQVIPSGCCGMAGSFGYEQEHYALSMQIGELVLFPAVRAAAPETLLVAPGTSCRHQVFDGTQRRAQHPATLLRAALRSK